MTFRPGEKLTMLVHIVGDQVEERTAYGSGVPGLVVCAPAEMSDHWRVCHWRSGLRVGCHYTTDPEQAIALAYAFAPLADWTLSGEELRQRPELLDEVNIVAERLKLAMTMPNDPIKARDLNGPYKEAGAWQGDGER